MTHEEATQIISELNNDSDFYKFTLVPYCGEYLVRIEEKEQFKHSMALFSSVVKVIAAHGKACSITTSGDGYRGIRVTLI